MAPDGGSPRVLTARRRWPWVLAVVAAVVLLPASPAAADPPGPTDYESRILAIEPEVDGVTAEIVGGDGFLLLEVDEGTTVEVPGYAGEPYLRFGPDGTVEENQESAATFLNDARTRTPDDQDREYDPEAEPRWAVVATDGRWAWHDHRIHHMAGPPPAGARTPEGFAWDVPIVVDGTEVTISGSYRLLAAPSPWPWVALAAGIVVVALVVARRVAPLSVAGVLVLLAGIGGVVAGSAQRGVSPPGAPTSPLVVILPAIAVVAGTIVVLQRGRVLRAVSALAGAAAVGTWAAFRLPVLWSAILPTSLSAPLDRFLTAGALGGAIAAAVLVIRSGALAPELEVDLTDDAGPAGLGDPPPRTEPASG